MISYNEKKLWSAVLNVWKYLFFTSIGWIIHTVFLVLVLPSTEIATGTCEQHVRSHP